MGWPSSSRSERFPPPAQFFRLDLKGITRERFFVYPPCTLRCGSGACGYAVTSHSSQGQTADRVLIHIDTERVGEKLVNRRLAYVALSRGRYDAQLYTNDKPHLAGALGREVSHQSVVELTRAAGPALTHKTEPRSSLTQERQRTIERDLSPSR